MLGAFAGAGVLSGLGAGMEHERNLQEALDSSYKENANKEDMEEKLQSAKDTYKQALSDNTDIAITKAHAAAKSAGQQLGQFNTDSNGFQGNVSPPAQSIQGIPNDLAGNTMPPTRTAVMPPLNANATSQIQPPITKNVQSNSNQASPAMQPPPSAAIPPSAPDSNIQGMQQLTDAKQALATNDPEAAHKVAAVTLSHTFWNDDGSQRADLNATNPEAYELYTNSHSKYTAIPVQELAAHISDYLANNGTFTDRKDLNTTLSKQNELALKDQSKAGLPVQQDNVGDLENNSVKILQNEGVMNKNEKLLNLTPGQEKTNEDLVKQAYQTKVAASQGLDTFARMVGDVAKTNPGPGQTPEMFIQSTWAKLTNSERSEALTKFSENQKNSTQALNAQINIMRQMGGRFIVGQKVLELEKGAIPDLNSMSPQASLDMAQTYINGYKQAIGASDAMIYGGEHLSPTQRLALADTYAEKNPAADKDGLTPNENFREFRDFQTNKGATTGGVTGVDKREQLTKDTQGATSNAQSGGPGAVPNQTQNTPKVVGTYDPNKGMQFH